MEKLSSTSDFSLVSETHGLLHPIMLFEGRILDGRHRYKACLAADVTPMFLQFSGKDPIAYVSSENRHRRHLSPAQMAHSIAAMKPFEERKARERMAAGGGDQKSGTAVRRTPIANTGSTAEILAKKGGVSTRPRGARDKARIGWYIPSTTYFAAMESI